MIRESILDGNVGAELINNKRVPKRMNLEKTYLNQNMCKLIEL